MSQSIFLTRVRSPEGKACARILIDSIRTFGGEFCNCPIWVLETNSRQVRCGDLAGNGVRVIPLEPPDTVRDYIFGDKVYACAQAETMAMTEAQSLVWIDPNCLVVHPPLLFDLGATFDAAVRPVHIRNVGVLATDPLDDFWKLICESVGVQDIESTVESFVDCQRIRAYFNSHAFAVNPAKGLMRRWFADFEKLVCDPVFQARACADEPHRLFLFQAILSVLLVTTLDSQRIRLLPPTYNYSYHLHAQVPMERRAQSLSDLVCVAYEDNTIDLSAMTDIQIDARWREWLAAHQPQ